MLKNIGVELSDYQDYVRRHIGNDSQVVTIVLKFKSGMSYHCTSKRVKGIGIWKNFDKYIKSNLENAGNVLDEVCIMVGLTKSDTLEENIYIEYWKPNEHIFALTGNREWILSERRINNQELYDDLSSTTDVGIYL